MGGYARFDEFQRQLSKHPHFLQIMILLATVFGCIGVLTASSLAYNAALDLSAPHTLSPATYADPLRNASAYAVKSRKPRALVPWKKKVPGMQVPVVTDEYTRKLKMDGITERMGINLRPVRDDGAFPDGLPHWFSEFLFRKGEDLGPRGHTRLVATENCDMIVVRKVSFTVPLISAKERIASS